MTHPEPDAPATDQADPMRLKLLEEALVVTKRRVERGVVRVRVVTRERTEPVSFTLRHERIEIERVAVGRQVDAVPAVREEGDVTIMPVVEEVLVVERRLMLKEEVRIRRVRTTEQHTETVTLRSQDVVIERPSADGEPSAKTSVALTPDAKEQQHGR